MAGLTVETKANGVLLWLVHWARQRYYWSCLGCSSRPSTKYFFLTVYYFTSFVPIAQQAGQAVVPRRLPLNICLSIRLQKQTSSGEFPLYIFFPMAVCMYTVEEKECANLWAVRGTMTCNFSRGCIGVGVGLLLYKQPYRQLLTFITLCVSSFLQSSQISCQNSKHRAYGRG